MDAVALQLKGALTEGCDFPAGLCKGSGGLKLVPMESSRGRRETDSSRQIQGDNTSWWMTCTFGRNKT